MIEAIGTDSVSGLVPVAAISVSTQVFKNFGVEFTRDVDDLDSYEIAAFKLNNQRVALFRYLSPPVAETELMVAKEISSPDQFMAVIKGLADQFKLSVSVFHWQDTAKRGLHFEG